MGNSCGCCGFSHENAVLISPTHPQARAESTPSLDSIMLLVKDVDPVQHIDLLIDFIENQLTRMEAPTEASSSGGIQVESVASSTTLAAKIIDLISTEAQTFAKSEIAKAIGSTGISVAKVIGETHWMFLALSMTAHALERCVTVTSNVEECRELLLTIATVAKDLKKFKEAMDGESEKVGKMVTVVADHAFMCCHYIDQGRASRYWSATTIEKELLKTREQIREIWPSLTFTAVTQIARNLTLRSHPSPVNLLDFKPVGIEKQISEVEKLLDMSGSDPAVAVILQGFGGVGKTTLAAAVIQNLDLVSTDFKFCRVIIDEKAPDQTSHILELQRNIIQDFEGKKYDLRDADDGRGQIQRAMENKCCFLFVDNVVDSDYIRQLLPKHLLPASENSKMRILITSRGSDVSQTDRGGVPLLLSVFGNQLKFEREEGNYEAALAALDKGDLDSFAYEDHVAEKLLFVYNKMNEEDQETFLDICVYYHGNPWHLVSCIVGERNLETFRRRMLLSKSDPGEEVIVHDILRLMGRKEAKGTRLRNYEELEEVITDESKLRNVKGLFLRDDTCLTTLKSSHLNAMQDSLRVLFLGPWVKIDGPPCDGAFKNLRCLYVDDVPVFPFKDASRMENLKVFQNFSKPGIDLPRLPPALKLIYHTLPILDFDAFPNMPLQNLKSLERLYLIPKKPLILAQGLELPASLKILVLNRCKQVPKAFGHLTALEEVDLDECDMEALPKGFANLNKLSKLSMEGCTNLTSLSKGFGLLSSLTSLNLVGCTRLEGLPVDFGELRALESLFMRGCENLRALPDEFGRLSSLHVLDLTGCINLQRLPESFGNLSLQKLQLESLVSLEQLPESIGNLPCLKDLRLIYCNSLSSLPDSFVRLKTLEILHIKSCIKLNAMPKDFGQLSSLIELVVEDCPKLKELPHGIETLPALKILTLKRCKSLENLPAGFGELTSLEELTLEVLMISTLPHGFQGLTKLKQLYIYFCPKLESVVNEFENLSSLRKLWILNCNMLEGKTMDKIMKLQHCYYLDIENSEKLVQQWKEMVQQKEEYPMIVCTSNTLSEEERQRATRIGLLGGQCIELNSSRDGWIEHLSVSVFKDTTSVAVIGLPHFDQQLLQRVLGTAIEAARAASSGQLRIICVKKVSLYGETPAADAKEEERITKILKWLPHGSLVIPSTDTRRLSLIKELCFSSSADDKVACFMADIRADNKGRQTFLDGETIEENNISEKIVQKLSSSECAAEKEDDILDKRNGEEQEISSWPEKFKEANIDHFICSNNSKITLDQLQGKTIGIIICDLDSIECIKLQRVYKDFEIMDSDFQGVWIPILSNEEYGFGTYARAFEKMPWASLPNPKSMTEKNPGFIIFDKGFETILNPNALSAIMAWGVKAYPFTQDRIDPIISNMHTKSSLKFLLEDMNFLDLQGNTVKESYDGKLIFLYAEPPSNKFKMKSKLEQLLQEHADCEILYVGYFCSEEQQDVEALEKMYEDVTQTMLWPKLSFWDMIMFWHRCKYLLNEKGEQLKKCLTLQSLVKHLYIEKRWLVLLDTDGVVTASGNEVVDVICKSNEKDVSKVDKMMKKGLIESLKTGKCDEMVKKFFKDELPNFPEHPQHPLFLRYEDQQ
ncbi:hypothetical protein KI387_041824 [Taxus chinensis]|uniref:NB-ARC domain-containing protein n=1 Tax=Taxus chinensis TaxID=29808 RepID=A0AA38C3W3_TAXCH|nr:hypothetical protein KI387_041824 [Taxus chinensis]